MGVTPFRGKPCALALPKVISIHPRRSPCNANSLSSLQRGLTLIEVCATLAIASILVGTAAPSFNGIRKSASSMAPARRWLDRHSLRPQRGGDSQSGRAHSAPRRSPTAAPAPSSTRAAPQTANVVRLGQRYAAAADSQEIKTHRFAGGGPQVGPIGASMRFDPVRGTATPAGTLRIVGAEGRAIHHVVSAMGRVRSVLARRHDARLQGVLNSRR